MSRVTLFENHNKAVLALADGSIFHGHAFGAKLGIEQACVGEVVFNTSLFGYQEIITDPSYSGQMMCFTCPHIGNVGCNSQDIESSKVHVEGIIIRNESLVDSNFRSEESLNSYLLKNKKMGLAGIDTRALVKHIRDQGAQMGAMAAGEDINTEQLVELARSKGSMLGKDYVSSVTCKEPYAWTQLPWSIKSNSYAAAKESTLLSRPHVVVLDCGVKFNILRLLLQSGFRITIVPAYTNSEQILHYNPDALFLSNGPGDPSVHVKIVDTVKELLGRFPIFGICLGHQILAQAFGAKTYKMKFGHRGGNHPVLEKSTGIIEITTQNHGFAVDKNTLTKDVHLSHINLNDQTVEGIEVQALKAFSVQHHPESSPGPHDSDYLFKRFFEMVIGYSH